MASFQDSATPVTYCREKFATKSGDSDDHIMETFILDGEYAIKHQYVNKNRAVLESDECLEVEHCKSVYRCGNILFKHNEPKIWEYIDLIIEATHNKKLPVSVDRSVRKRTQKIGGTICPTKDIIFAYDGKLFVLYGRYIYGYDNPYVRFVNQKPKNTESEKGSDVEDDDDEDYYDVEESDIELPASLSEDEIVLPTISYKFKFEFWLDDYNYSFAIIDAQTEVLLAFGLYR